MKHQKTTNLKRREKFKKRILLHILLTFLSGSPTTTDDYINVVLALLESKNENVRTKQKSRVSAKRLSKGERIKME